MIRFGERRPRFQIPFFIVMIATFRLLRVQNFVLGAQFPCILDTALILRERERELEYLSNWRFPFVAFLLSFGLQSSPLCFLGLFL